MSSPKKAKKRVDLSDKKQRILLTAGIISIAILSIGGIIFGVNLANYNRALNRTNLSGVDVGGQDRQELTETADNLADRLQIEIKNGENTVTAALADLGVRLDRTKTADNAITLNGARTALTPFLFWQPRRADVSAVYDTASIKTFLQSAFPDSFSDPVDAKVEWNGESGEFQTTPAAPQKFIDPEQIVRAIDETLSRPTTTKIMSASVATTEVQPIIGNSAAEEAAGYLNERLNRIIQLYVDGRVVYHSTPHEIADWVQMSFDGRAKKYAVNFDLGKIENQIRTDMSGTVSDATRDQINFASSDGREVILQAGANGYGVINAEEAAAEIDAALKDNRDLGFNLAFDRTDFRIQTFPDTGEHWMEVNLTNQTATMHSGDVALMTYSISSGKYPIGVTYPGTFHITWQARIRDMPDMPHVEWISYFDAEGRAFHATYWHNSFGQPMSHGCINMTYLAAEAVYWFMQPGGRVEIHW